MQKSHYLIFAIILIMLNAVTCSRHTIQEAKLSDRGLCAHRGAMTSHPENTLSAFKEAIQLGAHMIELDVRLTKDQKLVILHDATVDRTTDGSSTLADLTLAEVKSLDAGSWKSAEFKDEKIPTFAEALAVMPDNIWLNIHLKGGYELGRQVAEVVVAAQRMKQSFLACGFDAAAGAKNVNEHIQICNMERQSKTADYVQQTIERKAEFIQLLRMPVNNELRTFVEQLKKNNVKINYCCTDDKNELADLLDIGIDFVLVNDVKSGLAATDALNISRRSK
jgi:glycerophosphoryl diester phosphodiesterase